MTAAQTIFWLQLIEAIAAASIPIILGLIAAWAKQHFKLAAGSNAATILDLFVTAATQEVNAALAKAPTTAAALTTKNATINAILSDLSVSTQAAMALKGVTAATLAARIDGAVAMALSQPAAAPAPATPTKGT